MAGELQGIRRFLYDRLKANGTLTGLVGGATPRIYTRSVAPQGVAYPLVLLYWQGGRDVNSIGAPGTRILHGGVYVVKGITEGASDTVPDAIVDAIDAAIQGASGTVVSPNVTIHGVRRRSALDYDEVDRTTNARYTHRGGLYEFWVSQNY